MSSNQNIPDPREVKTDGGTDIKSLPTKELENLIVYKYGMQTINFNSKLDPKKDGLLVQLGLLTILDRNLELRVVKDAEMVALSVVKDAEMVALKTQLNHLNEILNEKGNRIKGQSNRIKEQSNRIEQQDNRIKKLEKKLHNVAKAMLDDDEDNPIVS